MGHRTVVVLNNDYSPEWENDPDLGKKIRDSASLHGPGRFRYGQVVEITHADTQSMVLCYHYTGKVVGHVHSKTIGNFTHMELKELAEQMGYRISKKPTKEIK